MENTDSNESSPGVELAALPRERVGPFLILGVSKDADSATIDAHWAQRVLWARQTRTRIPLENIHWARAVLRDPDQRLAADVASLNADTVGDELRRLAGLYGLDPNRPSWQPIDPEPPSAAVDVPDPNALRSSLPAPAVPLEFPGVARWLEQFVREPLDPWGPAIPPAARQDSAEWPTPPT